MGGREEFLDAGGHLIPCEEEPFKVSSCMRSVLGYYLLMGERGWAAFLSSGSECPQSPSPNGHLSRHPTAFFFFFLAEHGLATQSWKSFQYSLNLPNRNCRCWSLFLSCTSSPSEEHKGLCKLLNRPSGNHT